EEGELRLHALRALGVLQSEAALGIQRRSQTEKLVVVEIDGETDARQDDRCQHGRSHREAQRPHRLSFRTARRSADQIRKAHADLVAISEEAARVELSVNAAVTDLDQQ